MKIVPMSIEPSRRRGTRVLAALAFAAAGVLSTQAHAQESLVITNVHVVDVKSGTSSAPSDVRIEKGIIATISPHASASKVRAQGSSSHALAQQLLATSLDGRGGYLVPGFWDMHAHVNFPEYASGWLFPMMLASGVTGVRDMAGDCWAPGCEDNITFMRRLQRDVESGVLAGPRLLAISSAPVNGPRLNEEDTPDWAEPRTSDDGAKLVAQIRSRGVDLIKAYDTMPREAYFGMMSAAKAGGLPVGGHVPLAVSTLEALDAGQVTIDHAKHPLIDCSRYSATFHQVYSAWAAGTSERIYSNWAQPGSEAEKLGTYYPPLLAGYDESLCRTVISRMADSPVWYVPTLITRRFEARAADDEFLDDARLASVPAPLREEWEADAGRMRARFGANAGEERAYQQFYDLASKLVGESFRAGVRVLVGTDSPDSYCFPGDAFHEELLELRTAGLPNAAILRAATLGAAEYLGRSQNSGSVEPGKIADLLLLTDDPLQDISRTRHINAVISNGRVWELPQLRRLRADAEQFAAHYGRAVQRDSTTP
jgi:hypothetical protein